MINSLIPFVRSFLRVLSVVALISLPYHYSRATESIDFVEDFALADDREKVLKQLIPGTRDYYYYHALHHLNEGNWDQLGSFMEPWLKRYGETAEYRLIRNREALIRYPEDNEKYLSYIGRQLGLEFNHRPRLPGEEQNYPTRLDPATISRAEFQKVGFEQSRQLNNLEDSGIDWILRNNIDLDEEKRRDLLRRLVYPDYERIVGMIAADLRTRESRGFGEFPIHRNLLPEQLEELLRLEPALARNQAYVHNRIAKMIPGADVDWKRNRDERLNYLNRVWEYAETLDPSFNSLKAHVLYQLLLHHRNEGNYPDELWMTYLQLPKPGSYIEPRYLNSPKGQNRADLNADFREITHCPPVSDDEKLVREFFLQAFVDAGTYEAYTPFVRESLLKRWFAEARLTSGAEDADRWFSMLSPSEVQGLRKRVDIDFAPGNPTRFAPADPVTLEVDIKNVSDLVVRVYEINTLNYYLDRGIEIDTDLDLDGLAANEEFRFQYEETDIRRTRRSFTFNSLAGKRGVWILEFIGNGVSSRALIRKGQLQYVSTPTAAGTLVTILNEENEPIENPAAWFGGKQYEPGDGNGILLPFSSSGSGNLILLDGSFAALETITLPEESYQLTAGFHVERETLLAGSSSELVVRPSLFSSGRPTTVDLLEEVTLLIRATDLDGITTTEAVPGFRLHDDRESIHPFNVPRRLQALEVVLEGRVPQVSKGGVPQSLKASRKFELNGIDRGGLIADLHLGKHADGGYLVEVLGKSGEPISDRVIQFTFDHEDYRNTLNFYLKSDKNGVIALGELDGIETVSTNRPGLPRRQWNLRQDSVTNPEVIHAMEGEPVQIALASVPETLSRSDLVVMETRHGSYVEDHYARARVRGGLLELGDLPRGDHEVYLRKEERKIMIRVSGSEQTGHGFILSDHRHLENTETSPLQVDGITEENGQLSIRLANSDPATRVHAYATRFLPEYSLFGNFQNGTSPVAGLIKRGDFESRFVSGRDIGEEYRYILERKRVTRFPGNMAARPGLLLNPWDVAETRTGIDDSEKGEGYDKSPPMEKSARPTPKPVPREQLGVAGQIPGSPNLDFLPVRAPLFLNLVPDDEGRVTLDLARLGDRQHLHVVAINEEGMACRSHLVEPKGKMEYRDLRLKQVLPPDKHFSKKKRVTLLREGNVLRIKDIRSSELESYSTIGDVFSVLSAIGGDEKAGQTLREFSFVSNWPELAGERKRTLYSKYACHELNFFLSRKDPEFFAGVVQPYLANKRDKTFLDHYLLESDLNPFLEPWRFGRLNIVEKILLAQRLGGELEQSIRRTILDRHELIPAKPEIAYQQYNSALRGRRMSGSSLKSSVFAFEGEPDPFGGRGGAAMADAFAPAPTAAPAAPAIRPQLNLRIGSKRAGELREEVADELTTGRSLGRANLVENRRRALSEALYREMDSTREWAENNYYQIPMSQQLADLISLNDLWKDFANWNGQNGFYSRHFPAGANSFSEMIFVLSVLDLPFSTEDPETTLDNEQLTLQSGSPLIVFHEEIDELEPAPEKSGILLSQNFFRADDRYEMVAGERIDRFVEGEFLTGVLYGCQVVVTNPTASTQNLDLLLQVPEGAVPASRSKYTQSEPVRLQPFTTARREFFFYFPGVSEEDGFAHFPVHVSKKEQPVAWGEPFRFTVVEELTEVDTTSWEYLSRSGTSEQVLDYLRNGNVHAVDLSRIAWRVRENAGFLSEVTAILRERHAYAPVLWGYGLRHNDPAIAREFLSHQESFLRRSGGRLECELVSIDPVERHWYQHLEYAPLVNARVHRLGGESKILNDRFHGQYHEFLSELSFRSQLDEGDKMGITYYLFLQDRIEEALEWFDRIQAESLESVLQYDYLNAYASLYRELPEQAAAISARYRDYGVERWQKRFAVISEHVGEIQGSDESLTDATDRENRQDVLASLQPALELNSDGSELTLGFRNLNQVTLRYYEMDLEFLFSSQPFVSAGSGQFGYIMPNLSDTIDLPENVETFRVAIPERFEGRNVLVEASSEGLKKSLAVYTHSMNVHITSGYGRLQVVDETEGTPLPGTYIKVYARHRNGSVRFFKDGYTDLRGKFDYVSLNTSQLPEVERFSILIMNDEKGAVVREVPPPRT